MTSAPSANGSSGQPDGSQRDAAGRFGPGNRLGRGNPWARRTAELRAAMFAAVSDDDVAAVVRALVAKAREGDVVAARELLGRLVGDAVAAALEDRIAALEALTNGGTE